MMAAEMVAVNSLTDNACASAIFRSFCTKASCACPSSSVISRFNSAFSLLPSVRRLSVYASISAVRSCCMAIRLSLNWCSSLAEGSICTVFLPPGESFHKVQQVGFFFHQEGAERVYLRRTHEILAAGLHGLQQAVRPQPPDAVVPVVRLFPADDAFAQCGEGDDVALGDGDVTPYLLYFACFGFYLVHPSTLMHQNGGHATNDRHQDQIPGKDFRL